MVILDNGHGIETKGKSSPLWKNGTQLFEWEFNRDIVRRISEVLKRLEIPYLILVTETSDIPLDERVRRVNNIYSQKKSSFLVSIHANAGGGSGFESFAFTNSFKKKTKSHYLNNIMCDSFVKEFPEEYLRGAKEANFQMLRETDCPAVLTESFFMDNERDCRKLLNNDFRNRIAHFHIDAIIEYLKKHK